MMIEVGIRLPFSKYFKTTFMKIENIDQNTLRDYEF